MDGAGFPFLQPYKNGEDGLPGRRLGFPQNGLQPLKTNMSPKKGTISIGNTSEPTIDFQGTFVRFPGIQCPWHHKLPEAWKMMKFGHGGWTTWLWRDYQVWGETLRSSPWHLGGWPHAPRSCFWAGAIQSFGIWVCKADFNKKTETNGWLAAKTTVNEDVSPIKTGGVPFSC